MLYVEDERDIASVSENVAEFPEDVLKLRLVPVDPALRLVSLEVVSAVYIEGQGPGEYLLPL